MIQDLKAQLRRPPVIIAAAGIIAIGIVSYALITNGGSAVPSVVYAAIGPIVENVQTNGTVKAAQEVDLSFQTSGRIVSIGYDVGSHAPAGAMLASLFSADQGAQLEQAKAALAMQQAKLDSLKAGATPQSIAASQTAVSNAEASVAAAEQSVMQASQDAYGKADDAIHNRVDQLFTNPRTASPSFNLLLANSQLELSLVSNRAQMESELSLWQNYEQQQGSVSQSSDSSAVVTTVRGYINDVATYLDLVSSGLTYTVPSTAYPLSAIQNYQNNVSLGRTNLSTSLLGLNAAATALTSAQSTLLAAQAQLSVTTSGATANDIAAQQAQVQAAQASVDYAAAQVSKTGIYAPISGTIIRNDAHVGSTASPGIVLISMISDSLYQMETYVSDADVGKIALGQQSSIALDAYPGVNLGAHVIAIDPAATVQNGISSYKVTLQLDVNDARIKAGMSGTATITAATKANALTVPTSAIIQNGATTSVIKQVHGSFVLTPVTVGITTNANTEILAGLQAGDTIRAFGQN